MSRIVVVGDVMTDVVAVHGSPVARGTFVVGKPGGVLLSLQ